MLPPLRGIHALLSPECRNSAALLFFAFMSEIEFIQLPTIAGNMADFRERYPE
jgi:hypothetical protein